MAYSNLQGRRVNLRLLQAADLTNLLSRPDIQSLWDKPADLETLQRRVLRDHSFTVWELLPSSGGASLGFAGIVSTGSPELMIDFLSEADIEVAQDAMMAVVAAFFESSDDDWLFVHVPREVEDECRSLLVEAGFDPIDTPPGHNAAELSSFVLRRSTYNVYYGENPDPQHT